MYFKQAKLIDHQYSSKTFLMNIDDQLIINKQKNNMQCLHIKTSP